MTVKHKGNQEYEGLSTDTKPLAADTAVNATFAETDTGNEYRNNGTAWVLFRGGSNTEVLTNKELDIALNTLKLRLYTAIVFKSGPTYYALNASGAVISSGAVAETVIQAALSPGGTIFVADGIYSLSGAFTGFTIATNDRLILGRDALIQVPNGYNGYVIKITGATTGTTIEGGIFNEAGTPARLWTWLWMDANSTGIYACIVRDCIVESPNIGIRLYAATTTGWINDNFFENIKMTGANVFVDFDYTATWPGSDGIGFWNNVFIKVYCQMSANSTHGFKNIRHGRNVFVNCVVWDAAGAQINSNLHADSRNCLILGGIMTYLNFTNAHSSNWIMDQWQGFVAGGDINLGLNKVLMSEVMLKRHGATFASIRNAADSAYMSLRVEGVDAFSFRDPTGVAQFTLANPTIGIVDAKNIALGTTTGTKIGTATNQKLGFFNKTPIVQPAAITAPDTTGAQLQFAVNAIRAALTALGLTA